MISCCRSATAKDTNLFRHRERSFQYPMRGIWPGTGCCWSWDCGAGCWQAARPIITTSAAQGIDFTKKPMHYIPCSGGNAPGTAGASEGDGGAV